MDNRAVCLIFLLLMLFSCKKEVVPSDSGSTQLWIKVGRSVPDFSISLKCASLQNKESVYTVSYQDQALNPNLKTASVNSQNNSEAWVMVYKDFDRTDEIELRLANGKVYKTKGFEYKEKRVIEVVATTGGAINVVDRDISIIEKLIWVD